MGNIAQNSVTLRQTKTLALDSHFHPRIDPRICPRKDPRICPRIHPSGSIKTLWLSYGPGCIVGLRPAGSLTRDISEGCFGQTLA